MWAHVRWGKVVVVGGLVAAAGSIALGSRAREGAAIATRTEGGGGGGGGREGVGVQPKGLFGLKLACVVRLSQERNLVVLRRHAYWRWMTRGARLHGSAGHSPLWWSEHAGACVRVQ